MAPAPNPAPPTDIEGLIRTEEKQVRDAAVAAGLAEAERRRLELLEHLHSVAAALDRERGELERQRALFQEHSRTLAGAGNASMAPPSLALLQKLRLELHAAHIDLAKYESSRSKAKNDDSPLASLTFGQMSWIGLAVAWPIGVAIILGFAILALTLIFALGA